MPNFNKKFSDTNIRIGEVRFSYAHVFEAKENPSGKMKYSVSILIPKEDKATLKIVKEAIEAARENGKANKWGGKIPPKCNIPLRDGDEDRPDDPAYAGCYFINASSDRKPGVMVRENGAVSEALDIDDFYSGCYGCVTLNFYAYDTSGNRGVAAGLNNVIKTRDGERLSGGASAAVEFADLDGDDDLLD